MSNGAVILCVFSDCFSENYVINNTNSHFMLWPDFSTKRKCMVKPFNGKVHVFTDMNTTIHKIFIGYIYMVPFLGLWQNSQ